MSGGELELGNDNRVDAESVLDNHTPGYILESANSADTSFESPVYNNRPKYIPARV